MNNHQFRAAKVTVQIEVDALQLAASFIARNLDTQEIEQAIENPDKVIAGAADFLIPWDNDYDVARADYTDALDVLSVAVGKAIVAHHANQERK